MTVKDFIKHLEKINPEAEIDFDMTISYEHGELVENSGDVRGICTYGDKPEEARFITVSL